MSTVRKLTKTKPINESDYRRSGNSNQHEVRQQSVNISDTERWVAGVSGGLLALYGLSKRSLPGTALAILGGSLVYRGITGHCEVYKTLGINHSKNRNSNVSVRHGEGHKVEKSINVNKSPEELYSFWRDFKNLPRFMTRLESVRVLDDERSYWTAKNPAGTTIEWAAEIINDKENELIAWRSLEGAGLPNAGSVHFEKAPNGHETQVRVVFSYEPPGGIIGAAIAKLFGVSPEQQLEEDLRRFKQLMETGETVLIEGQSSGRLAKSAISRR
jgi:uncharacterized membrane protein